MAPRSQFPLVDQIMGGRLAETLTGWRDEGLSFEAMARRLEAEHQVNVTGETLRNWFADLQAAS